MPEAVLAPVFTVCILSSQSRQGSEPRACSGPSRPALHAVAIMPQPPLLPSCSALTTAPSPHCHRAQSPDPFSSPLPAGWSSKLGQGSFMALAVVRVFRWGEAAAAAWRDLQ